MGIRRSLVRILTGPWRNVLGKDTYCNFPRSPRRVWVPDIRQWLNCSNSSVWAPNRQPHCILLRKLRWFRNETWSVGVIMSCPLSILSRVEMGNINAIYYYYCYTVTPSCSLKPKWIGRSRVFRFNHTFFKPKLSLNRSKTAGPLSFGLTVLYCISFKYYFQVYNQQYMIKRFITKTLELPYYYVILC